MMFHEASCGVITILLSYKLIPNLRLVKCRTKEAQKTYP